MVSRKIQNEYTNEDIEIYNKFYFSELWKRLLGIFLRTIFIPGQKIISIGLHTLQCGRGYGQQFLMIQHPDEPRNQAIPGYAGHIPYVKSDNIFGRPYSAITRESFARPQLGVNRFNISTNGFMVNDKVHIDPSQTASTFSYGAQTIQKNAPCWDVMDF